MDKNCKQCKHFNLWGIRMAAFDDVDVCRKKVWECRPGMIWERIHEKLKTAESCTEFEPRNKKA